MLLSSCRNEASKSLEEDAEGIASTLKYAEGFSVAYFKNYKVITVSRPWPDAKKKYQYAILNEGYIAEKLSNESFDAVIESNVNDIVVTSTTHIPHLELLKAEETLVGFPGTD
jgi:iron complex transport system substrate-binding protein